MTRDFKAFFFFNLFEGSLPQYFKFGEVNGVPDEHCEIDGLH